MDTPDFFIGARLGAARAKAGIPIEKAAADTRIRVERLREIEADDFSGFSHPTYVRLFLLDYAEYLGLPQDEIRPLLPDRAGAAPGGFEYINALAAHLPAMAKPARRQRFRILATLATIVLLLLLAAAGLFAYFTIKKIERVARSKPPAEITAPPSAAPDPVAAPEEFPLEKTDAVERFVPAIPPPGSPSAPPTP
ncbi:MAG: helix-turn-helix transcriptional regulator [Verrucomicrobiae bacterium]